MVCLYATKTKEGAEALRYIQANKLCMILCGMQIGSIIRTRYRKYISCGPMDKASAFEAEDSGFEPRHGFFFLFSWYDSSGYDVRNEHLFLRAHDPLFVFRSMEE